jgi:hypothetical protein
MRDGNAEASGDGHALTTATMEPVTWVMRLHEGVAVLGDPYFAHSSVSVDDLGCATLRGFAMAGFTVGDWRAVVRALGAAGIKEMIYTRKKLGVSRVVRVRIAPEDADAGG